MFPCRSNQPSLLLELIDQFLYERKIGFKLINTQLCEAKISVMRVGLRAPTKAMIELFLRIVKEWILSQMVAKNSYLDVTAVLIKKMRSNYE